MVYYGSMPSAQRSQNGRAFTVEEHRKISEWNGKAGDGWPRIELALNYPDTPEMLGLVEHDQPGPTLFVWADDWGLVVEPFSGGSFTYLSLSAVLSELSRWAEVYRGRQAGAVWHQPRRILKIQLKLTVREPTLHRNARTTPSHRLKRRPIRMFATLLPHIQLVAGSDRRPL